MKTHCMIDTQKGVKAGTVISYGKQTPATTLWLTPYSRRLNSAQCRRLQASHASKKHFPQWLWQSVKKSVLAAPLGWYWWQSIELQTGMGSELLACWSNEWICLTHVAGQLRFTARVCVCVCVCVSVHPHILALQQILAAFIAVCVRHHVWVDTGVFSAG